MLTGSLFEVKTRQCLDGESNVCGPLPEFVKDRAHLVHLYQSMLTIRTFDKKAIALQRTGQMGTYASIYGQEAISTAIGQAMHKEDVLIPYYRDYAAQCQRGVLMSEILSYWGGDERGNHYANNAEDLPICVPIASQCLHAAGVAFALKYRNEARVAVTCIGDGGTSEGDFYEAMNVAGLWKLPLVFVINNNQWAISVPLSKQTATQTLAQKAIAAGFEGIIVDGNDVIALEAVLRESIAKARTGGGPTLIEAITYRLGDHTTADDASRYRDVADVSRAELAEPILRLKRYLEKEYQWSEKEEAECVTIANRQVEEAVNAYTTRKPQPIESIFDYHYATLPNYLIEQRATAMEEYYHG